MPVFDFGEVLTGLKRCHGSGCLVPSESLLQELQHAQQTSIVVSMNSFALILLCLFEIMGLP